MWSPLSRRRGERKLTPNFSYFIEGRTLQGRAPLGRTNDTQAQVLKCGFVNPFRAVPYDDAGVSLTPCGARVPPPLGDQLSELATDLRVLPVVAVESYGDLLPARRLDDRSVCDRDSGGSYRPARGARGDEGLGLEGPFGDDDGFIAGLSLALLVISMFYSSWSRERAREANIPVPAMETVVLSLRTFHRQTGRFSRDFNELDERVWKGARRAQISPDGKSLTAPRSHYFYTLHTINLADPARATGPAKAAVWAVPTGGRAQEAATYFWYVTPQAIEGWMGPALTRESVGAACCIPSEQQLALLAMTRQPRGGVSMTAPRSRGVFSLLPF